VNIDAIDHLEFYVEDIDRSARELSQEFGFRASGSGGPETGLAGCRSLLLRQQDINILLTSAISQDHPAAEYVRQHGDGVAVVALTVDDARDTFAETVARGAIPVAPPMVIDSGGTRVTIASVEAFGDVTHRFVQRESADAPFGLGLSERTSRAPADAGLLKGIDHLAVCLPAGALDETVRRYANIFGFNRTFEERIVVGSQAMDSKVVQSASGGITLTIIEPDITRSPGQIDKFVRDHGGAGVQHVAFLTEDIATAVAAISGRGVPFLTTPSEYYDLLPARLGPLGVPLEPLRDLNILADRDHWGLMLQIFTKSRHPRGTYFHELIERRGARSFGSGNIKALYEAVDRQQAQARR
jgi:4-hydroxymandelate synthase